MRYQSFLSPVLSLGLALLWTARGHPGHTDERHHNHRVTLDGEEEIVRCGAKEPEQIDHDAQLNAMEFAAMRADNKNGTDFSEAENSPVVIPVCFHNPQGWAGRDRISSDKLQMQLDALNEAFSSSSCCDTSLEWCEASHCSLDTNIQFVMAKTNWRGRVVGTTPKATDSGACITRRRCGGWTSVEVGTAAEYEMKRTLRKGDAKVLNIYFSRPQLLGSSLLGYATFPWHYKDDPTYDGVVVHPSAIAGSSSSRYKNYNEGDTLIHETGHWLGLFHTFQNGCASEGISDTPAQATYNSGCSPPGPDSCPLSPGVDPIFNFLDYSFDRCMYEFTEGQAHAMHANIKAYRSDTPINRDPIALLDGVPSETVSLASDEMQTFTIAVPTNATTSCRTGGLNGDVDLFMNFNGLLQTFDCKSNSKLDSNEECVNVGPATENVTGFAFVFAKLTTINFTVTCDIGYGNF